MFFQNVAVLLHSEPVNAKAGSYDWNHFYTHQATQWPPLSLRRQEEQNQASKKLHTVEAITELITLSLESSTFLRTAKQKGESDYSKHRNMSKTES